MMYQEHVDALTISELRLALRSAGLQTGPITASTETVYRTALYKYLIGKDECDTEQGSPLNSSNSDVENVESGSASDVDADLELDEASELQVPVPDDTLESSKKQFTPIRWNEKFQRYETVYGENSGPRNSERFEDSSTVNRWLYLVGISVICFIFAMIMVFRWENCDPYQGLEDVASKLAKPSEKVPLEDL